MRIDIAIIAGGGEDGRDLYQITITGKVVDDTGRGLSERALNRITRKIQRQIERSFSGSGEGIEFETVANITASSDENPLSDDDHAFRIVDDVAATLGRVNPVGGEIQGNAPAGQNLIYLQRGTNYSSTGAHEFGHSAGLAHIRDETEVTQAGNFIPLSVNDYPGNLMHQSRDVDQHGNSVAGTRIEPLQIRIMQRKFRNGQLNQGRQQ